MKKFLYISEIGQQKNVLIEIDEPTQVIDRMWHHFILFTEDYKIFRNRFFGKMVHHAPFSPEQLAQAISGAASKGVTLDEYKQLCLETQLNLIQSVMGIETVRKWYVDYANTYSPRRMNALQRAFFHHSLDDLAPPLDPEAAAEMSPSEMIESIIQQTSPSMHCRRQGCRACRSCRRQGCRVG